ncbi:MAG: hypothetical protein CM15mP109_09420 [Candidatus Dadabacteria bacterium]|nr:MAG: hypothetical protein CM15mP109_09420 [Candidatus Dadabacteria bacterium]
MVGTKRSKFLLPDENTLWKLESQNSTLSPNTPVVISWENGNGLKFIQRFSIDENYLFTFTQEVENNTLGLITLFPLINCLGKICQVAKHLVFFMKVLLDGLTKIDEQDYDDIYEKIFEKNLKMAG